MGMKVHGGGAEQAKLVYAAVAEETISSVPGGVEVRDEGRKLVVRKAQATGEPVSVVLLFNQESGAVSRVVAGSGEEIAKLDSLKFHHSGGRLFVKCQAKDHESKKSWATSRWKSGTP